MGRVMRFVTTGELEKELKELNVSLFNLMSGNRLLDRISSALTAYVLQDEAGVREILIFHKHTPRRFIFKRSTRISFKDRDQKNVFYDIVFDENFGGLQAMLYHTDGERLFILQDDKADMKGGKLSELRYTLFESSYAELQIHILHLVDGIHIQCLDKTGDSLLHFCSFDLVADPIQRFIHYMQEMSFPFYQVAENAFLKKVHANAKEICESNLMQKAFESNLLSVSDIMLSATKLYLFICKNAHLKAENEFICRIIRECISVAPKKMNSLTYDLMRELLEDKFYSQYISGNNIILYSMHVCANDLSLESFFDLIDLLAMFKNYLAGKEARLEIIIHGDDLVEKLNSFLVWTKDRNYDEFSAFLSDLGNISFVLCEDTEFDWFTYYINIEKKTKAICSDVISNLSAMLNDKIEIIALDSYAGPKTLLYSNKNIYIFHQKCDCSHLEYRQGDNLFCINTAFFDTETDEHMNSDYLLINMDILIKKIFDQIDAYFDANSGKEKSFNHIIFCIDSQNKTPYAYINNCLMTVVNRCSMELIDRRVFSFVFRYIQKNHGTPNEIIIKYKNDTGYYFKQPGVQTTDAIESRRRKAIQSGGIWAYDIPDLLKIVADEFRVKNHIDKPHDPSYEKFIELEVDPASIEIDEKTGMIDCDKGSLILALADNGSPRPQGKNIAGVIIGVQTLDLGIGLKVMRVLIIGDLTHVSKGAITSEECLRINLAIQYAYKHGLPIDWFSASFGVKIDNDSGVENLDASASTCRTIVRYSQDYGMPINIVVCDTNIGAQSYWDALAAICLDTHSILIMTAKGAMSLTGHLALTSAFYKNLHSDDIPTYAKRLFPQGLQSLAGYRQVHGPNGEATEYASNISQACEKLLRHHFYTYAEHFQQMAGDRPGGHDYHSRSIYEHTSSDSKISIKQELKKIMNGLIANRYAIIEAFRDQDSPDPLYLWEDATGWDVAVLQSGCMPQISSTIVCEIILGNRPVMLIFPPLGSLTPLDSEVIAKAIGKASGHLPVVILGYLTGFNSDPLSMQNKQLSQGASIVRAIVHYQGALIIINLGCMIGGSYVVFSRQLNSCIRIIAVEGAKAQVTGGNIASKVIFHSRICKKAKAELQNKFITSTALELKPDKNSVDAAFRAIVSEMEEKEGKAFEKIHDAQRAKSVGSVDVIIPAAEIRREVIYQIEDIL